MDASATLPVTEAEKRTAAVDRVWKPDSRADNAELAVAAVSTCPHSLARLGPRGTDSWT